MKRIRSRRPNHWRCTCVVCSASQLEELSIRIEFDELVLPPGNLTVAANTVFAAISIIGEQYLQRLQVLRLQDNDIEVEQIAHFIRNRRSLLQLYLNECDFMNQCWERQGEEGIEDIVQRMTGFTGLRADDSTKEA